jgi:hypothetical protein
VVRLVSGKDELVQEIAKAEASLSRLESGPRLEVIACLM